MCAYRSKWGKLRNFLEHRWGGDYVFGVFSNCFFDEIFGKFASSSKVQIRSSIAFWYNSRSTDKQQGQASQFDYLRNNKCTIGRKNRKKNPNLFKVFSVLTSYDCITSCNSQPINKLNCKIMQSARLQTNFFPIDRKLSWGNAIRENMNSR